MNLTLTSAGMPLQSIASARSIELRSNYEDMIQILLHLLPVFLLLVA
jgi:hypothetical protein